MEGMLVMDVTSDRESGVGLSSLEPLEHSVLVLALIESADTFVRTAVSNPLEHSGPTGTEDVGQKLLPLVRRTD